mgnify:CR=1 FL=1
MHEAETVLTRNLILVLGDQLSIESSAFDGFDRGLDKVWMAEVADESERVWSSKPRIVMFLSAMRHFRDNLLRRRYEVCYTELTDPESRGSLAGELERRVRQYKPDKLIVAEPGKHRVQVELSSVAKRLGISLEIRADRSFFCSREEFGEHADGRQQLRMEYFYRAMRRRFDVLMSADGGPEGGRWNYDASNRRAFGRAGPGRIPPPESFPPDRTTREVIKVVNRVLPGHPGSLDAFDWPVTPSQASAALSDFVANRLSSFGAFQDAMWIGQPFLYHSLLSAAMNLKLLDPRRVVAVAEEAYRAGVAPLNAAEGFIRQVLGWREYVRGVYWRFMPEYIDMNALNAREALPAFYWTGDTDAACLREAITQTFRFGYAHHIQRLMITGLFALLLGVDPKEVHRWYLAVYVDAVEWVELPNTLGMSQFADGGVMASKPYAASGKYIKRMSDYCNGCRFCPAEATGDRACPFTSLYWAFLVRHERLLASNARMGLQLRNLDRFNSQERSDILAAAGSVRDQHLASR